MLWIDFVILGLLAISSLIGLFRGFVKEVFSLVAWIVALWVSIRFAPWAADNLLQSIQTPSARIALAYVGLFLITLILGAVLSHFMTILVNYSQLQGTDRSLGLLFGALRGVLIVAVLVVLGRMTPLQEDPWWHDSLFVGQFETIGDWLLSMLPDDIAERFEKLAGDVEDAAAAGEAAARVRDAAPALSPSR